MRDCTTFYAVLPALKNYQRLLYVPPQRRQLWLHDCINHRLRPADEDQRVLARGREMRLQHRSSDPSFRMPPFLGSSREAKVKVESGGTDGRGQTFQLGAKEDVVLRLVGVQEPELRLRVRGVAKDSFEDLNDRRDACEKGSSGIRKEKERSETHHYQRKSCRGSSRAVRPLAISPFPHRAIRSSRAVP